MCLIVVYSLLAGQDQLVMYTLLVCICFSFISGVVNGSLKGIPSSPYTLSCILFLKSHFLGWDRVIKRREWRRGLVWTGNKYEITSASDIYSRYVLKLSGFLQKCSFLSLMSYFFFTRKDRKNK